MALVCLCAIVLMVFLFASGSVNLIEASLTTLGVGSLIFYYVAPIFAKRKDYIGSEPKLQITQVNVFPYLAFVVICLSVAAYGWLSAL